MLGAAGEGVAHTTPYGATAYRPPGAVEAYPVYHPPVAVPYYAATGCYGCAAAAGAVVGAAVATATTAAATQGAYNAGVAAGVAATGTPGTTVVVATGVAAPVYQLGVAYAAVPAGCATPNVSGQTYYLCGNTWFLPQYGANGVYYRVVPAP